VFLCEDPAVESDRKDFVSALLFWATPALTSAQRVLLEENFSPWGRRSNKPSRRMRESDAALMVLSLRNVLRAARWAAQELRPTVGEEVDRILVQFGKYLPGLVDARNALEHFDEYALGRGWLQRSNPVPYDFELTVEDSRPVVTVGPIRIDVEHARDLCRWLVVNLLARVPIEEEDDEQAEVLLDEVLKAAEGESSQAKDPSVDGVP
jgi:hypothetical protein